jgi:hypothetical protein
LFVFAINRTRLTLEVYISVLQARATKQRY